MWLWAVVVKNVLGSHFGVGGFTAQFRTYFSGWIESEVHWGLTDLDFDPRPYVGQGLLVFLLVSL